MQSVVDKWHVEYHSAKDKHGCVQILYRRFINNRPYDQVDRNYQHQNWNDYRNLETQ